MLQFPGRLGFDIMLVFAYKALKIMCLMNGANARTADAALKPCAWYPSPGCFAMADSLKLY